jgi:hypothetical protein
LGIIFRRVPLSLCPFMPSRGRKLLCVSPDRFSRDETGGPNTISDGC